MDSIAVLDFGSQYSQLIARRVRELNVYSELFPWDAPAAQVQALHPKGYILSGGPTSVYDSGAPVIPDFVLASGLPVLGICYGMQALTHALGGRVAASSRREYGSAEIESRLENPLLPSGRQTVWMSHGDRIEELPSGFSALASSANSPIAAMGDLKNRRFGVQFHPAFRQGRQQGIDGGQANGDLGMAVGMDQSGQFEAAVFEQVAGGLYSRLAGVFELRVAQRGGDAAASSLGGFGHHRGSKKAGLYGQDFPGPHGLAQFFGNAHRMAPIVDNGMVELIKLVP